MSTDRFTVLCLGGPFHCNAYEVPLHNDKWPPAEFHIFQPDPKSARVFRPGAPRHLVLVCTSDAKYHARIKEAAAGTRRSFMFPGAKPTA